MTGRIPVVCAALVLLSCGRADAQSPLVGLSEIKVEIVSGCGVNDNVSPLLARLLRAPAVAPFSLQTQIELEIRRSTPLRIVPHATASLRLFCGVNDMTTDSVRWVYVVNSLRLVEPATLIRNGVLVESNVWVSNSEHTWGGADEIIPERPLRVDRLLNTFLNAYLAANPKQ